MPDRTEGARARRASSRDYWDGIAREWADLRPQRLWRRYCDRLNASFFDRWLPREDVGRALKTDLFDEVTGESGLYPVLAKVAGSVVGIDLAEMTLHRAHSRHPDLKVVGASVCELPFADRTFDLVLSNSTLDHFESRDELAAALSEIRRVMKAGGRLLLTLDNLANPVLALRSILPYRWLRRLRLVPYYMGTTCGPRGLRRLVGEAGLSVEELDCMMHCPRAPAVLVANALDRLGSARAEAGFLRVLMGFERMAGWPTRYVTGYFVALRAVRSDSSGASR